MDGTNIRELLGEFTTDAALEIVLIVALVWLLISATRLGVRWLQDRLGSRTRLFALAGEPLIRLTLIMLGIALIVPRIIEPSFENLVALLGAVGLALGFAFKDYASSLIAGIVTLFEMPYRQGDWIEVEGAYGEVRTIGMRAAQIVTPDDTVVVIPHLKLWTELIRNGNDGSTRLMCIADFYLDPQHDARQVRRLLHDVALTSPYLKLDEPIAVIVHEKPFGTHYRLKAYPIDPRLQFNFTTDLTVRGKSVLLRHDVAFAAVPAMVQPA